MNTCFPNSGRVRLLPHNKVPDLETYTWVIFSLLVMQNNPPLEFPRDWLSIEIRLLTVPIRWNLVFGETSSPLFC